MKSPTRLAVVSFLSLVTLALASGCNIPEYAQNEIWVSPPCTGCVANEFHAVFTNVTGVETYGSAAGSTSTQGSSSARVSIRGSGAASVSTPVGEPTAEPGLVSAYPNLPVSASPLPGGAIAPSSSNQLTLNYSETITDDDCAAKANQALAQGASLEVYGEGSATYSGGQGGCSAGSGTNTGVVCDDLMTLPTTSVQATQIFSCEIVPTTVTDPLPSPTPSPIKDPRPTPTATPL